MHIIRDAPTEFYILKDCEKKKVLKFCSHTPVNLPKLNVPSSLKTAAVTTEAPPQGPGETGFHFHTLEKSCFPAFSTHLVSDGGQAVSQANAYKNNQIIAPFLQCHVLLSFCFSLQMGLPRWLSSKEPTCNAGDPGLIPDLGRSPGEGNSNPLQYSCLENPMDRGAWRSIAHGVTKSWTQLKGLSTHTYKLTDAITEGSGAHILTLI